MKKKLALLIATLLLLSLLPALVTAAEDAVHAPRFDISFGHEYEPFDIYTIDWYCEEDAEETGWYAHNFVTQEIDSDQAYSIGTTAFLTSGDEHYVEFRLGFLKEDAPGTVEYIYGGSYYGQTPGRLNKFAISAYDWKVETWYTVRIQVRRDDDKTYYEQWIKEEDGDWVLLAVISLPQNNLALADPSASFLDRNLNNHRRVVRFRNAYGYHSNEETWVSFDRATLTNLYMSQPVPEGQAKIFKPNMENVNFNADFGVKKDYLWLEVGGGDTTAKDFVLPAEVDLDQDSEPEEEDFLDWEDYQEELKMFSVPDMKAEFSSADQLFDILTMDFYNVNDRDWSSFRPYRWHLGRLYVLDNSDALRTHGS